MKKKIEMVVNSFDELKNFDLKTTIKSKPERIVIKLDSDKKRSGMEAPKQITDIFVALRDLALSKGWDDVQVTELVADISKLEIEQERGMETILSIKELGINLFWFNGKLRNGSHVSAPGVIYPVGNFRGESDKINLLSLVLNDTKLDKSLTFVICDGDIVSYAESTDIEIEYTKFMELRSFYKANQYYLLAGNYGELLFILHRYNGQPFNYF